MGLFVILVLFALVFVIHDDRVADRLRPSSRKLKKLAKPSGLPAELRATRDAQQTAAIEALAPTRRTDHARFFAGIVRGRNVGLRIQAEFVDPIPRFEPTESDPPGAWPWGTGQTPEVPPSISLWISLALTKITDVEGTRIWRDDQPEFEGDTALAAGLMTSEVNGQLRKGDQIFVESQQLAILSGDGGDSARISFLLDALIKAAERLESCTQGGAVDKAELLRQVVKGDPATNARVRAFRELWKLRSMDGPKTLPAKHTDFWDEILQDSLRSSDLALRLEAADATNNVSVCRQLAQDLKVPDYLRRRALNKVLAGPHLETLLNDVRRLLQTGDPLTLSVVLAVVEQRKLEQAVTWMQIPKPTLRQDVAEQLLAVMRRWPSPEHLPLLKALTENRNDQVARFAVDLMGDSVDGALIPFLEELSRRKAIKHSAQMAIAEIKARHAPKAGGLSMIEPAKAGQLAIAEATPGSVSELDDTES